MKEIIERLLVMRDTIDDIISQLEDEIKVVPSPQEQLENIIFNPRLFNTNEKLAKLKYAMKAFISINSAKDEK